jgi:hypothetical protein
MSLPTRSTNVPTFSAQTVGGSCAIAGGAVRWGRIPRVWVRHHVKMVMITDTSSPTQKGSGGSSSQMSVIFTVSTHCCLRGAALLRATAFSSLVSLQTCQQMVTITEHTQWRTDQGLSLPNGKWALWSPDEIMKCILAVICTIYVHCNY